MDVSHSARGPARSRLTVVGGLLLTAGCAAAPPQPAPRLAGPSSADREVTQLLAEARRLQAEWEAQGEERRARRERLARLAEAPDLFGLRRRVSELAEAAGASSTSSSRDWERGARHVRMTARGSGASTSAFCAALAREWPGSYVSGPPAAPTDPSGTWVTVLAEARLRAAPVLPPPPTPPPALPDVPPAPEAAVPLLRAHLLRLHRALREGEARLVRLREAEVLSEREVTEPVWVSCEPLAGPT